MNSERLHDDFPISVRCESSDTVVFVACPRWGRYGDVRKTLAGLLQRPFASIHIAPISESESVGPAEAVTPYDDATIIEATADGVVQRAQIVILNDNGQWTRL